MRFVSVAAAEGLRAGRRDATIIVIATARIKPAGSGTATVPGDDGFPSRQSAAVIVSRSDPRSPAFNVFASSSSGSFGVWQYVVALHKSVASQPLCTAKVLGENDILIAARAQGLA